MKELLTHPIALALLGVLLGVGIRYYSKPESTKAELKRIVPLAIMLASGALVAGATLEAAFAAFIVPLSSALGLGRKPAPPTDPDDGPPTKPAAGAVATLVLMLALLPGCAAAGPILRTIAEGANWFSTVVDAADTGASAYFARHPNEDAEVMLADILEDNQDASEALAIVAGVAEGVTEKDYEEARADAIAAYIRLMRFMVTKCILHACPPDGGAENTDAPMPVPLDLPTISEVMARI